MVKSKRDVTATRAKDVTYLNDTGKPMYIMVGFSDVAGEAQALSDSATPPTESLGVCGSESVPQSFPFMVRAGDYYKIKTLSGSITINKWIEWF